MSAADRAGWKNRPFTLRNLNLAPVSLKGESPARWMQNIQNWACSFFFLHISTQTGQLVKRPGPGYIDGCHVTQTVTEGEGLALQWPYFHDVEW